MEESMRTLASGNHKLNRLLRGDAQPSARARGHRDQYVLPE
jgi:hypothetical protein